MGKYLFVTLCGGAANRRRSFYVHQVVLMTFVGPCPPGMEAIHLNDVQHDNRLENLEWGTHKRNCELRRANGREKLGEQRRNSKLKEWQACWILLKHKVLSDEEMARTCGVAVATVRDVWQRRTWRHVPGPNVS